MNSDLLILDILKKSGYLETPFSTNENRIIKQVLTNYFKTNSNYRSIYHIDIYGCYTLICMTHCLDNLTYLYYEFLARITHFWYIENSLYLLEYYDIEEYRNIPILAEKLHRFDKNYYNILDTMKMSFTKIVIFQILGIIYIEDFLKILRLDWNVIFSSAYYIKEFLENPLKVMKFLDIIIIDNNTIKLESFIRRIYKRKSLKFSCKENRIVFLPYDNNVFFHKN